MNGFLGSTILEAAIGASLIYFILAIFCTTANDFLAGLVGARAENLGSTLRELLNDQNIETGRTFLEAFYGHPLIGALMKDGKHPPHLPVRLFSTAVIDLATSQVKGPIVFADLEKGISNLPEGDVRTTLLALIQNTECDLAHAQASVENWFNDAMGRASGWYKRRAQVWNIVIATGITLSLNADTLSILHRFWAQPSLHAQPGNVLGWDRAAFNVNLGDWFSRVVGWGLTIAAVSLGAPFWYDLLKKFSNFNSAGHASEDKDISTIRHV